MPADPDDQLLERLRAVAAEADPVPAHVDEAASAALSTRHLDELARLLADSDEGAAVLTRGEPGAIRLLSFGTDQVAVELQVVIERDSATLRGLLTGAPGPVLVEVRGGGTVSAEVDEDGYFTVSGLPTALVRLRAGGTTTEWVSI
jgi:hypothetical protein